MYNLFGCKRLLNISGKKNNGLSFGKPAEIRYKEDLFLNGNDLSAKNVSPSVHCYAFPGQWCKHPILALSLTNDTLLFYGMKTQTAARPFLRQLPWFTHPLKQIAALCYDPSGCWLVCATRDATLFILPVAAFAGLPITNQFSWSTEDMSEIRFSGRRAVPTAVKWWLTSQGHPIAIIGNELGEISFVNLELRKEVGGTYITVSIMELELVSDNTNNCVYLLITGSNDVQWQLVLEGNNGSYQYPLEKSEMEKSKPQPGTSSISLSLCMSVAEDHSSTNVATVPKDKDLHPKRLVQYAGHTRLRSCHFRGKNYIAGYYTSTGVLTLHGADLKIVPLFIYKLPPDTWNLLLKDQLIFVLTKNKNFENKLLAICTELAGTTLDGKNVYNAESEMQRFDFSSSEDVLGIVECHPSSGNHDICLIVTNNNVYCIYQRTSTEDLFLRMVLQDGTYTRAERFAKIMAMDVGASYEKAAEVKLQEGQVPIAVRLYQMAKCPHIRSVANFAAYGHLSELLSYVRVLFTTANLDFSQSDLKHFSNVALYCYIQQCLELRVGGTSMLHNFREFLYENQHYDEQVAIHLLATYGFYDLLMELAELRGLICEALEELLSNKQSVLMTTARNTEEDVSLRPWWTDLQTATVFREQGFDNLVYLEYNDGFVSSMFRPHVTLFVGLNSDLIERHLAYMKQLSRCWENDCNRLKIIATIYDPSNPALAPIFRQSARKRNVSCGSVDFIEGNDFVLQANDNDEEMCELDREITTLFLKVLLQLNRKFRTKSLFDQDLVLPVDRIAPDEDENNLQVVENGKLRLPRRRIPLATGFAHSAVVINGRVLTWGRSRSGCLGRGPERRDWLPVESIPNFEPMLKVLSVACGAAHTIILTDMGVYGCGCNRYCQLGLGKEIRSHRMYQPVLIERLSAIEVAFITCGQYHSLALAADGTVYSWGWSVHGQLGHGHPTEVSAPTRIEALSKCSIIRVSAGHAHTIFLSAKGEVFVCGCGTFGQLGTGSNSKESMPIHLELPEVIALVAAGHFHNVAVSITGKIYTWGCNPQTLRMRAQAARRAARQNSSADATDAQPSCASNAVYDPSSSPGVFTPMEIDSSNITAQITQVACGCNHSAVVTCDGEVYTWGRNLDGQLGHDSRKEQSTPTSIVRLNDRKSVHVACGGDFTLVLDDSGKVWGFGVDDCGQIGGATDFALETQTPTTPAKIITLRTSKRIIYVKPPMRCSILQPVVLNGLPSASSASFNTKFVYEEPVAKKPWQPCGKLWEDVEKSQFTDHIIHSALEQLYKFYGDAEVEELCQVCGNLQAAGKVALLRDDVAQSFSYNVKAISSDDTLSDECKCSTTLQLLETFLKLFPNDTSFYKPVLESLIEFWSLWSGPPTELEEFFISHITQFIIPLCAIIFRNPETEDTTRDCVSHLLGHLSNSFCFALMSGIMEKAKSGVLYPELVDLLAQTTASDILEKVHFDRDILPSSESISTDHLWSELMQNLRKDANSMAAIELSSMEVKTLVKDIGGSVESSNPVEVVLFTCGHHYSDEIFKSNVLPCFEQTLAQVSPVNYRTVVAAYESSGFKPMACPKCHLDGLQQEAS